MRRVVKLNIPLKQELVETVFEYNKICNKHLSEIIRLTINDNYSKKKLHKNLYKKIRKEHPNFPSPLIQTARDVACEMFKNKDITKLKRIKKNKNSSIRYDLRTSKCFLDSGELQLTTTQGRKKYQFTLPKYFRKYKDWFVKGCSLGFNKKYCYVNIVVENEVEKPDLDNPRILGIDRGIKNIIACSDGNLMKGSELVAKKRNYAYLRKQLQEVGTPSAKRKLKKIRMAERRFTSNYNHILSKRIVEMDYDVFAIEDLDIKTNHKANGKKGKWFNRIINNWSRNQLVDFLTYKAEERGKQTIKINPHKTSQRCSKCGYIKKSNRKKGLFKCKKCGFQENADINASKNILQLGHSVLEQAVCQPAKCNITPFANSNSYKPLPLGRGS